MEKRFILTKKKIMTSEQIKNLSEVEFNKYREKICNFSRLFKVPNEKGELIPLILTE